MNASFMPSPLSEVVEISDTEYTLSQLDSGKWLRFTSASPVSITIFGSLKNCETVCEQAGAGVLTFAGDTGVTVNTFDTLSTAGQYAAVVTKCVDDDGVIFTLAGRTAAS